MFLSQVRYGFATNSSSSHSVILASTPQRDEDVPHDFGYGWDNFILASVEAKRDYFFVSSRDHFEGTPEWEEFVALVNPSPELLTEENYWGGVRFPGYIDHESASMISASTIEGVKAVLHWLDQPRVTILGGNDNETYDFGIQGIQFEPWDLRHMKHRQEARGSVYFDRSNGTKLHFFDRPINFDEYIASAPELVDIKVTDWCDLACRFCYQDSTNKGKHAPFQALKAIIDDLAEAGVFEVALGGGEPMSHPQFIDLLEYCDLKGIVPNFTTKNYAALAEQRFSQYAKWCGSIGVSVATPEDVSKFLEVADLITCPTRQISLQVAMGAQTAEQFQEMLDMLKGSKSFSGLILLGYKNTGRGQRAKGNLWYEDGRVDGQDPISMFRSFQKLFRSQNAWYPVPSLSMDTEMVRSCEQHLARNGVRPELYMKNEGRVSCYIDAVSMRIAPSSYCDGGLYRDYNFNVMHIWPEMSEEYHELTKD